MFGHWAELGLVLLIALIVFGPEKLPEVAHNVGKFVRDMRDSFEAAMDTGDHEVPDDFSQYYYESLARSGESPAPEWDHLNGQETEEDEEPVYWSSDDPDAEDVLGAPLTNEVDDMPKHRATWS